GAVRPRVEPGGPPCPDRRAAGRRGLRRGVVARIGPLARRADDHPADAGPALGEAAGRAMAAGHEATVRPAEAQVWPAVAGGDRELDDQAATRLGAPRAGGGEPVPRDRPAGHYT